MMDLRRLFGIHQLPPPRRVDEDRDLRVVIEQSKSQREEAKTIREEAHKILGLVMANPIKEGLRDSHE